MGGLWHCFTHIIEKNIKTNIQTIVDLLLKTVILNIIDSWFNADNHYSTHMVFMGGCVLPRFTSPKIGAPFAAFARGKAT